MQSNSKNPSYSLYSWYCVGLVWWVAHSHAHKKASQNVLEAFFMVGMTESMSGNGSEVPVHVPH